MIENLGFAQWIAFGILCLATLRIFFNRHREPFWYLFLLSPAFIFIYPLYASQFKVDTDIILLMSFAIMGLGLILKRAQLGCIFLSLISFGLGSWLQPLAAVYIPFFGFLLWQYFQKKFLTKTQAIFFVSLFIAIEIASIFLSWKEIPQIQIPKLINSDLFCLSFIFLICMATLPILLTNWLQKKYYFLICSALIFATLFLFINDWGRWIFNYYSLIFILILIDSAQEKTIIQYRPIAFLMVLIYCTIWSIQTPLISRPSFGLYEWMYNNFPIEVNGDPLVHPFWREAGRRYEKVEVGQFGNIAKTLDPDKLSFFLKRAGMKKINYRAEVPQFSLVNKNYDTNTLYILDDPRFHPEIQFVVKRNTDLLAKIDGFLVFAPGWKVCKSCREIDSKAQLFEYSSPISLTNPIYFSASGSGQVFLGLGWSKPEVWGVWSDGVNASLTLPLPVHRPRKILINARTLITQSKPTQTVLISINGKEKHRITLSNDPSIFSLPLDFHEVKSNYCVINFHFLNPNRPKDLGINEDKRLLGIGLISTQFVDN